MEGIVREFEKRLIDVFMSEVKQYAYIRRDIIKIFAIIFVLLGALILFALYDSSNTVSEGVAASFYTFLLQR